MTLNQIAYSLMETLNTFKVSTDERVPLRFLYKKIRDGRAILAKNRLKERATVDPMMYQLLECIEIMSITQECEGISVETDQKYIQIPGLITALGSQAISFIKTPEGERANIVSVSAFDSNSGNVYTSANFKAAQLTGGLFYLKNLPNCNAKYLNVLAVLEDPMVHIGCKHLTPDDEYPMPVEFTLELELMIRKDVLSGGFPGDFKENDGDNPRQTPPMTSTVPRQ